MYCINCKNSQFITDEYGNVSLKCNKFDKDVFAYSLCVNNKKMCRDNKIRSVYMSNYQNKSLNEIAKMCNISKNQLNYFVNENFLPRKKE